MPNNTQHNRPTNGSRRGKNAFLLTAVMHYRPTIERTELLDILKWNPQQLDQALQDVLTLSQTPQPNKNF